MKNLINAVFACLICILFCSVSYAGNLHDGMKAAKSGNYAKAHDLWLLEAEKGNPIAQYNLALLYVRGLFTTHGGLIKDLSEAERWLLKAAVQGKTEAQYNLGVLYAQGPLQDFQKAKKWFLEAAQKGFPLAQCRLGYMFVTGTGVDVDFNNAAKWVRKCAMNDVPEAQLLLGNMYYEGKGVSQDKVEAYAWWVLAKGKGHPDASTAIKKAEKEWDPKIIKAGFGRSYTLAREVLQERRENEARWGFW